MRRLACLCVLLGLILGLGGCGNSQAVRETVFAMDTVMDLQIWGSDGDSAARAITSLLTQLDGTWSATKDDSLIAKLNRGENPAMTEDELYLLNNIEALSSRTGGAFNPWMLSVSQAWGFYGEEHRIPTDGEISSALAEPRWDLGAALKGYAGDKAVEILEGADVDYALLNLGGNIQTYGQKADGTPWQIGIQNPSGSDYIGIISVVGTYSIVTSGDYQRYFEENGVRYHHIIDPETGKPARSGLKSVTVICKSGLTADALSTALFVMGLAEGITFWQESDDFEAVFLTAEGAVYATEGVALSGCEYEVICREN